MIIMILKVIGIIILLLLCLCIFMLSFILFLPVRYRFDGSYYGKIDCEFKMKWMPLFLKVNVSYHNQKLLYVVKLFGAIMIANTGQKISWIGRKFFDFRENDEMKSKDIDGDKKDYATDEVIDEKNKEVDVKLDATSSDHFSRDVNLKFHKKKKSFFLKLKELCLILQKKWDVFIKKIKQIQTKKQLFLKLCDTKRFEIAKKDAIIYLKEFWDAIKPIELEGKIRFGMDDPDVTGYILGMVAMGIPYYHNFLLLEPDFQEKCLEGNLKGKGKIFLFSLLRIMIKVRFNKNLIKVIKRVQTIIEA